MPRSGPRASRSPLANPVVVPSGCADGARAAAAAKLKAGGSHGALEQDARRGLERLSAAIADVLRLLPGRPTRPRDLSVLLDLHQTLAWKICRLAAGDDLLADAPYVPGPVGLAKFLEAAAKSGASVRAVKAAGAAATQFELLVREHAGDRAVWDGMLRSLSSRREPAANSRSLRKASYRAFSEALGVQTRARVVAKVIGPPTSPTSATADVLIVRGYVGIRALRHGVQLPSFRRTSMTDHGGPLKLDGTGPSQPIDPAAARAHGGVPILRECCENLPDLIAESGAEGQINVRLRPGKLGIEGQSTIYLADIQRGGCFLQATPGVRFESVAGLVRSPVELLVVDVLVHQSLFDGIEPRLLVFSEASGEPWPQQPVETGVLPSQPERLAAFEHGDEALRQPKLPTNYRAAMEQSAQTLGWDLSEFRLWRTVSDFPLMMTALALRLELPD